MKYKHVNIIDIRNIDRAKEKKSCDLILQSVELIAKRDNLEIINRHIYRLYEFTNNAAHYSYFYSAIWLVICSGYYRIYGIRKGLQ